MVPTILGYDLSIPAGIFNMETQLKMLPRVLCLYNPMQKFFDTSYEIIFFHDRVHSQWSIFDEIYITSSVIAINSNISAESMCTSRLYSHIYLIFSIRG